MEHQPVLIAVEQYYISVVPNSLSGDDGSGNGQGDWYSPNGAALPSGTSTAEPFHWYARWLTGAVS